MNFVGLNILSLKYQRYKLQVAKIKGLENLRFAKTRLLSCPKIGIITKYLSISLDQAV